MEIQTDRPFPRREGCPADRKYRQYLIKWLATICLIGMTVSSVQADNPSIPQAETWNYTIRYKYGLVVMKAGSAQYRFNPIHYLGYDILSIFLYMRQNDYTTMNPGDNRYLTLFLGNKKTNLIIRYAGPTVFEGHNKQKHNAFFFAVDISDEVFSHAKNAMEIWVSDDEYHIPLKMKAKLKIGAAEAELM